MYKTGRWVRPGLYDAWSNISTSIALEIEPTVLSTNTSIAGKTSIIKVNLTIKSRHVTPLQSSMCSYQWLEIICPCNKGQNCCMAHKPMVVINHRERHSTGNLVPIKGSGQRCQFRRRNAKGGWADPKCKYSEGRDVVGQKLSDIMCLWCNMDCVYAPVDDNIVREGYAEKGMPVGRR